MGAYLFLEAIASLDSGLSVTESVGRSVTHTLAVLHIKSILIAIVMAKMVRMIISMV